MALKASSAYIFIEVMLIISYSILQYQKSTVSSWNIPTSSTRLDVREVSAILSINLLSCPFLLTYSDTRNDDCILHRKYRRTVRYSQPFRFYLSVFLHCDWKKEKAIYFHSLIEIVLAVDKKYYNQWPPFLFDHSAHLFVLALLFTCFNAESVQGP